MAKDDKGIHVAAPKGGEHVRHIEQTKEDRAKQVKEFREEKEYQRKVKEERFAAIRERKKNNKPDGSGGGINIEVTSDS